MSVWPTNLFSSCHWIFDLLQMSYIFLLEHRCPPTLTSMDTSSMQGSLTVDQATFIPIWLSVSIRDLVVFQRLLLTTLHTFQNALRFLRCSLIIQTLLKLLCLLIMLLKVDTRTSYSFQTTL